MADPYDNLPKDYRLVRQLPYYTVVDCHCGGEPAKVVVHGLPAIPGTSMLEKRKYIMENMDWLRETFLLEPRGYPCQNVNFIFPSSMEEATYGYVIAEQKRIYPAMSGHNTICVATTLLELGMVPMQEPTTLFSLEAPAGLIKLKANCKDGKVLDVTFRNAPAFVEYEDVTVAVPQIGKVCVSIAYGGMWYVIVDASAVGLTLLPEHGKEIVRMGEMIKVAAREQFPCRHPEIDYTGPDILVFREDRKDGHAELSGRNAVVMSNVELDWSKPETWTGMIDRSPCGTGTCAVMALLHAKKLLKVGDTFVHESIIGSIFRGVLVDELCVDGRTAVVPEITGSAWITQLAKVVADPTDPFKNGYSVSDIWG